MPPVRWTGSSFIVRTTSTVIICVFLQYLNFADGNNEYQQKSISMTADGWKPIVGNVRPHISSSDYQDEIKYYQNPILKETVKAEPLPTTPLSSTTLTTPKNEPRTIKSLPVSVNIIHHPGRGKIPAHTKHVPQYFVFPNHSGHGPHIPLSSVTHHGRPNGVKKPMKNQQNQKRIVGKKPSQSPTVILTAQSVRNEVFVPAPNGNKQHHNGGTFSYYPSKNVRTRENSGLGNHGLGATKLFTFKQAPSVHVEFSSHFPPNNLFQNGNPGVQHVIFQKQQLNEIIPSYQIETGQTLVPPPIFGKHNLNYKHNLGKINPEIRTPADKIIYGGHNHHDLILQLPGQDSNLFHRKPITEYPGFKSPTYEVTEPKWEDENTPPTLKFRPNKLAQSVELNLPPFLPTPYKPENVGTTQNDVSTIYNQLSFKQHQNVENPYFFDIKEVSTHYPIIETKRPESDENKSEITTQKRRKKLRTTTTTSTTSEPEDEREMEPQIETTTEYEEKTERPRRPVSSRFPNEEKRHRKRPSSNHQRRKNRIRPKFEVSTEENIEVLPIIRHFSTTTSINFNEDSTTETTKIPEIPIVDSEEQQSQKVTEERPNENFKPIYENNEQKDETEHKFEIQKENIEDVKMENGGDEEKIKMADDEDVEKKPIDDEWSEMLKLNGDEFDDNLDVTTNELEGKLQITTTTSSTTTTTTTTPSPTTIKSRNGRRPVKYTTGGPSITTRPRFSVKEYRQRLNQQTSSTTTSTEHPTRSTSENVRIRFPTRRRFTTTTTSETTASRKFSPKEPRTTTETAHTTAKFKPVNTRLRPFRTSSTTPTTTSNPNTAKVQIIKSNLFNRRRPSPVLSLKTRIGNKKKTEEKERETEVVSMKEIEKIDEVEEVTIPSTTPVDLLRNDAIYSQRVSDLTSSLKNDEYEGFKTLASSSRRIPNYYTLSTEDPILPIEAFFSNINEKNGEKE